MHQPNVHWKQAFVIFRILWIGSNYDYFTGINIGADRPDMQIGDSGIEAGFDGFTNSFVYFRREFHIEQNMSRGAQQSQRPAGNQGGADQPHKGVEPSLPEIFACQQSKDCQKGGQCVGENMKICRPEIMVGLKKVAVIFMSVMVVTIGLTVASQYK